MVIETKFDIGDILYTIHRNRVEEFKIEAIDISTVSNNNKLDVNLITYHDATKGSRRHNEIFKTKEELIKEITKEY